MAKLKSELKAILDKYGIDYRDHDKLWDCHGTLVLYHKAYELIAAQEGIAFDPPVIIEGRSADKIVSMLVVGHMGDRSEWSVGEAAPGNNKNSYPYAMAEKRAKDRVIAKLVGLSAYVYSEDEADDFKSGERKPAEDGGGTVTPHGKDAAGMATTAHQPPPAKMTTEQWAERAVAELEKLTDPETWFDENAKTLEALEKRDPRSYERVQGAFEKAQKAADQLNSMAAA